jgi:hypothetical protein
MLFAAEALVVFRLSQPASLARCPASGSDQYFNAFTAMA